jgi:hypothetical protein
MNAGFRGIRPGPTPAASRRTSSTVILVAALLATLAICAAWWYLIQQAGGTAAPTSAATRSTTTLLLACAGSLVVGGALAFGAMTAMAHRRSSAGAPAALPQLGLEPGENAAHTPAAGYLAPGAARPEATGWSSLWATDPDAERAPPEAAGGQTPEPLSRRPDEPDSGADTPLRSDSMTATSRALAREADELNACSLDLSALANGTLRIVADMDSTAGMAYLEVTTALLSATHELATQRAGRQDVQNCVIHARVTTQLLRQFLSRSQRPGSTPAVGEPAHLPAPQWQADEPELVQLADECLQTAELAAGSLAHFNAAEDVARERLRAFEAMASELQALAATSASVLRMTTSQVEYGNNIAHLAGRLAMGASCLNDDLHRANRAE